MGGCREGALPYGRSREHNKGGYEAWGNPFDLKIRAIGEKGDNLFLAEFGMKMDLERVLLGTPWMVGQHAIVLKPYDEKLFCIQNHFRSHGYLGVDSKPPVRLDEPAKGVSGDEPHWQCGEDGCGP